MAETYGDICEEFGRHRSMVRVGLEVGARRSEQYGEEALHAHRSFRGQLLLRNGIREDGNSTVVGGLRVADREMEMVDESSNGTILRQNLVDNKSVDYCVALRYRHQRHRK